MTTLPGTGREPRGLPRVLIADQNDAHVSWLAAALDGQCEVFKVPAGDKIPDSLGGLAPHVLIIGSRLRDMDGATLLSRLDAMATPPEMAIMFMVDRASRAPVPDEDSLYYVLTDEMSPTDVSAIVASAVVRRRPGELAQTAAEAARVQRMLEVPREFASQRDLAGAAAVISRALTEFLGADRAGCLFYDPDSGSLWSEGGGGPAWEGERELSARLGMAGFAARTGQPVCVERASEDSRYHRETDDPAGRGTERILVQPLEGGDGQVHAVMIAVRAAHREPFSGDDLAMCGWLVQQLAPLIAQLAMHVEAESVLESAAESESIFRREAALAHASAGKRGDVVRVSPRWIGWSYWLLVLILAAAGAFAFIARIPEYSSGVAVISQSGRTDVIAPVSGNLVELHVEAGERVEAGQLLATFYSPEESSQLKSLESEWEASLRAYLSNRSDVSARSAVSTIRSQRDAVLDKLTARAEHAGVVNDVRATVGQQIGAGDSIMSIARPGGSLRVVAFLPGADRPLLRGGMAMRLQLAGYPSEHIDLVVGSVGSGVIGPAEAERALGPRLAGSVSVRGSVVMVRAELDSATFELDGEVLELSHGMTGLAEVELRSESVVNTLIPGLGR